MGKYFLFMATSSLLELLIVLVYSYTFLGNSHIQNDIRFGWLFLIGCWFVRTHSYFLNSREIFTRIFIGCWFFMITYSYFLHTYTNVLGQS